MEIKLSEGSGGIEMQELIKVISKNFFRGDWKNCNKDSATLDINKKENKKLVFTSDSYVVTPLFFNGGDIGKLAVCGTVNDLAMMGAKPLGLSLSFVIEEGFDKDDFNKIIKTISNLSNTLKIPIVTGDTKVMEKGSLDKIIINTAGIGLEDEILDKKIEIGDEIVVSGPIGDHGATLLALRHDIEINVESDCKALHEEISKIKKDIKYAKDITRGGLASVLNEFGFGMELTNIPVRKAVENFCELIGIEYLNLACEGTFVCITSKGKEVAEKINGTIIGKVVEGKKIILKTNFGERVITTPSGNIVPRIC